MSQYAFLFVALQMAQIILHAALYQQICNEERERER